MACPFCYIPYNETAIDFSICKKVISRCSEVGVSIISFGGGDPFKYEKTRELISLSHDYGLEVHIDTNGLGLRKSDYLLIEKYCSLLGLPLDASNSLLHDEFRGYDGHFDVVIAHLNNLRNHDIRLKVNSVATKQNYHDMVNMPSLLDSMDISIWSLYQFYPQHDARQHESNYSLEGNDFDRIANEILSKPNNFVFEPSTVDERTGTYLFVSPNGTMYTHHPRKHGEYLFLGDFFSEEALERCFELCSDTLRPKIIHRFETLTANPIDSTAERTVATTQ